MAIAAQGCVITWTKWPSGSPITLQEVRDLDVRVATERLNWGGLPYFYRAGELTLTAFSQGSLAAIKVLEWGTLKISVPTQSGMLVLHEGYAQLLNSSVRATVNDSVLFACQFRLWGVFNSTGTII